MVWFGLCLSSKVYTMEVDRREKLVEQSTNAISNPSARSENTFSVNCPVPPLSMQVRVRLNVLGESRGKGKYGIVLTLELTFFINTV